MLQQNPDAPWPYVYNLYQKYQPWPCGWSTLRTIFMILFPVGILVNFLVVLTCVVKLCRKQESGTHEVANNNTVEEKPEPHMEWRQAGRDLGCALLISITIAALICGINNLKAPSPALDFYAKDAAFRARYARPWYSLSGQIRCYASAGLKDPISLQLAENYDYLGAKMGMRMQHVSQYSVDFNWIAFTWPTVEEAIAAQPVKFSCHFEGHQANPLEFNVSLAIPDPTCDLKYKGATRVAVKVGGPNIDEPYLPYQLDTTFPFQGYGAFSSNDPEWPDVKDGDTTTSVSPSYLSPQERVCLWQTKDEKDGHTTVWVEISGFSMVLAQDPALQRNQWCQDHGWPRGNAICDSPALIYEKDPCKTRGTILLVVSILILAMLCGCKAYRHIKKCRQNANGGNNSNHGQGYQVLLTSGSGYKGAQVDN
jgi:hypothetical protein